MMLSLPKVKVLFALTDVAALKLCAVESLLSLLSSPDGALVGEHLRTLGGMKGAWGLANGMLRGRLGLSILKCVVCVVWFCQSWVPQLMSVILGQVVDYIRY